MYKDESGNRLCGLDVVDEHGDRIGAVREVWTDERTGRPAWASVDTGFLGLHHSFVPLGDAVVVPEHLRVPLPRDVVENAPRVSPVGDAMAEVEQRALRTYYRTEATA